MVFFELRSILTCFQKSCQGAGLANEIYQYKHPEHFKLSDIKPSPPNPLSNPATIELHTCG